MYILSVIYSFLLLCNYSGPALVLFYPLPRILTRLSTLKTNVMTRVLVMQGIKLNPRINRMWRRERHDGGKRGALGLKELSFDAFER